MQSLCFCQITIVEAKQEKRRENSCSTTSAGTSLVVMKSMSARLPKVRQHGAEKSDFRRDLEMAD